MINHVLKSQQFSLISLERLFEKVERIEHDFSYSWGRRNLKKQLRGALMYNIFYEPSTRTRMSFASAAHHMGMTVVGTENAKQFSSAIKGESLEDTIRVLNSYYPDVIVLRHHEEGAAERAAAVSKVPIINAGDGKGQHPTQALLDVYTIWKNNCQDLDNLTVMIGGDLSNGRTARSLVYLMSKYQNVEFIFCSPERLKMQPDIKAHLGEKGVKFTEVFDNFEEKLPEANVVYWTRLQKERMAEEEDVDSLLDKFSINKEKMEMMQRDAILLHPLPRNNEISIEVDSDPEGRARYFEQAGNGMFVRMALLGEIL